MVENGNVPGRALISMSAVMALFPIGACLLQSFLWIVLYLRTLAWEHDRHMEVLLLAAILWLALGLAICIVLASELMKRGAFHRMKVSSDSIALAGELNLFLGLICFAVLINGDLGEIRFTLGLSLLSFFLALGLLIFSLYCIKSGSLAGDQFKMAENMALINGAVAILGTLYLMGFLLFPSYA